MACYSPDTRFEDTRFEPTFVPAGPPVTMRALKPGQRFRFRGGENATYLFLGGRRYNFHDNGKPEGSGWQMASAARARRVDRVYVVQESDGYEWFDLAEFADAGEAHVAAHAIETAIANDESAAAGVRVV